MLSRSIDLFFGLLYGKKQFQSFFGVLHSIALKGMNLRHRPLQDSGEAWVVRRFYECCRRSGLQPVVFDVGANEGQYAGEVLSVFGEQLHLHCFEPSSITYRQLSARFSGRTRVRLHPLGLSDREYRATFFLSSKDSTLNSLFDRQESHEGAYDGTEEVEITRLDDFCMKEGVPHIHFLKMDVEGNELSILRGASHMLQQPSIDMIQFEFSNRNVDARTFLKDFFDVLHPQYAIYRILRNGLQLLPAYHADYEIFTAGNYLAICRRTDLAAAFIR